jgi:hypothetical protein
VRTHRERPIGLGFFIQDRHSTDTHAQPGTAAAPTVNAAKKLHTAWRPCKRFDQAHGCIRAGSIRPIRSRGNRPSSEFAAMVCGST